MKRKLWLGIIGLAAASTAQAAIVTLTMSYNEPLAGGAGSTPGAFSVYATVTDSGGAPDNRGLFAYGVDINTPGSAIAGLTNRSIAGTFAINENDGNYDPAISYPVKELGFTSVRFTSGNVPSGGQNLGAAGDLIQLFDGGRAGPSRAPNSFRPAPYTNPDPPTAPGADPTKAGMPVTYADIVRVSGSDNNVGTVFNKSGVPTIPTGSIRLFTGSWTGTAPTIKDVGAGSSTIASVWSLAAGGSDPATKFKNETATVQLAYRDYAGITQATATLGATSPNTITPVGGNIAVSGSNGKYVSEVDPLSDPSLVKGSAPIVGIGDEAGFIYVMAKLNGTPTEVAALLASTNTDIDASSGDANFAALHAAYDSRFTGGSFNALFKFSNPVGAKVFNYDFTGFPNVTVDQLAAVPEPATMGLMAFAGMGLLARRRRNRA